MESAQYASGVGTGDGVNGVGPRVSAVDELQGAVVGGFGAIFHHHECAAAKLGEVVEQRVGHAVGASANYQSHHVGHRQSLLIHCSQPFYRGVGVGISLEISQISHCGIFACKKRLALLQLFGDRG